MQTTQQPPYEYDEWLKGAKISRITEHRLPAGRKPKQIRIGRRKFILESPAEWIRRVYEESQLKQAA